MGLLTSFALADTNPDDNYDDEVVGSEVNIVLSTDLGGTCYWDTVFAGSEGWSNQWYVLTGWSGGGLEIQCYDGAWVGDFYSVWIVDTATDTTVMKIFTTPEVETDYHHSCAINPLHTGTGTTYSDGTYFIYLMPGTYEFRVRDELFHVLWAEGIDPRTPDPWSPAGFAIGFHSAPHIIPDVPLGTVVAGSIMTICLVTYFGVTRFWIFRRRH